MRAFQTESAEEISDDLSYEEWEKKFVNKPEKELTNSKAGGIMKEKETTNDGGQGLMKSTNSGIIQSSGFKPATDIAGAEEYARNVLGVPNVSYKGVDVIVANEWNRGLKDTFDKFPELKKQFGFVGEGHERNNGLKLLVEKYYTDIFVKKYPNVPFETLQPEIESKINKAMNKLKFTSNQVAQSYTPKDAAFSSFKGVTINSEFGYKAEYFKIQLQKMVDKKFHPVGCNTIKSVLDHEIGHQLDDLLDISNLKIVQDLYNNRNLRQLTDDISEYAWNNHTKNKYAEMIAEAWSEYCNNPSPRKVANIIGKTIEMEYINKYGKP